MATPTTPYQGLDGWAKKMREMESRLAAVEKKDPFINSGIAVLAPGLVEFTGRIYVDQSLLVTGTAQFNGPVIFANQAIPNASLTNPLMQTTLSPNVTSFALTTTFATLASQTFTIPAGFTGVHVDVTAKVGASNSTASPDYVYARPKITRTSDGAAWAPASTGGYTSAGSQGASMSRWVADVSLAANDSVQIAVQGQSQNAAWAANASNYADVVGTLTWYRI